MGTKTSIYLIIYELVTGIAELLLGLGFLFYGNKVIAVSRFLVSNGIISGSHIAIVRSLERLVPYLTDHRLYIQTILLIIGVTKIISSIGLIKNKVWANHLLTLLLLSFLPFDLIALYLRYSLDKLFYLVLNIGMLLYLTELDPKGYLSRGIAQYRKK